jgi:RNA polymerase sigma-70 factor (ECF subfamily)
MQTTQTPRDDLYRQAAAAYGPALVRMARSWEADAEARKDLLQEMHLALWRSLATFDNRCSLRTWIYRVAHNAATSHVLRSRRRNTKSLITLEDAEVQLGLATHDQSHPALEQAQIVDRLYALIQSLNPFDRQVILLYLEGIDAASIAEVTGISSGYVATKIHRIENILADRFHNGGTYVQR